MKITIPELSLVVLVGAAITIDGHPLAALGFAVAWPVILWGPIAAHEAGHALVAVLTGNSLPHKDHLMAADVEGRVRAPEFDAGLAWLNSAGPIRLKDLKGKIVVLDFWTLC